MPRRIARESFEPLMTNRRKPRVLLADDDPTARLLSESCLSSAGFVVQTVANGQEALLAFRQQRPDLVVLDVEMPVLDGFAACRAIRTEDHERPIPIVMLTGMDDTASLNQAFDAGANDFICKPVHWATLPHRLRYVLRSSENLLALADSERNTQALLRALPDRILVVDSDGLAHEGFRPVTARDGTQVVRQPITTLGTLFPGDSARVAHEHLAKALASRVATAFDYDATQEKKSFEVRMVPHSRDSAIAIVRDITERKAADARIHQLAFYDPLTGLPNRQQMVRDLRRALESAERSGRSVAVLYIDLDQFKRINDTLGHTIGDSLLKYVAKRLVSSVRSSDYIARAATTGAGPVGLARLGGDEFVALMPNVKEESDVTALAERMMAVLRKPFMLDAHQLVVTPSVGIAIAPQHGRDIEALLMNADTAMYQAKAAGRNRYRLYSGTMNARSLERLEIESELRAAIASDGLALHYQPKVSLTSGLVVGVEALLRWHHAERGWIGPAQFIPIAEETGLIVSLGDWVIRTACQQLRQWNTGPLADLNVAINVSGQQFAQVGFLDVLLRHIWEHGIRPNRLELEITESMLLQDVEENISLLKAIKEAGLGISVDDFGTGYSSLSYLQRLPIDAIKIDRSFVQNLHSRRDDAAICAAILAMAQELGLKVVAEGVELAEQLDFLRQHRCDFAQGYLLGRPMPAEDLRRIVLDMNKPPPLAAQPRA